MLRMPVHMIRRSHGRMVMWMVVSHLMNNTLVGMVHYARMHVVCPRYDSNWIPRNTCNPRPRRWSFQNIIITYVVFGGATS